MSIECRECERDLRGGHGEECSRHPNNLAAASPREAAPRCVICKQEGHTFRDCPAAPVVSGEPASDPHPLTPVLLSQAAFDSLTNEVVALRRQVYDLTRDIEGEYARQEHDAAELSRLSEENERLLRERDKWQELFNEAAKFGRRSND